MKTQSVVEIVRWKHLVPVFLRTPNVTPNILVKEYGEDRKTAMQFIKAFHKHKNAVALSYGAKISSLTADAYLKSDIGKLLTETYIEKKKGKETVGDFR